MSREGITPIPGAREKVKFNGFADSKQWQNDIKSGVRQPPPYDDAYLQGLPRKSLSRLARQLGFRWNVVKLITPKIEHDMQYHIKFHYANAHHWHRLEKAYQIAIHQQSVEAMKFVGDESASDHSESDDESADKAHLVSDDPLKSAAVESSDAARRGADHHGDDQHESKPQGSVHSDEDDAKDIVETVNTKALPKGPVLSPSTDSTKIKPHVAQRTSATAKSRSAKYWSRPLVRRTRPRYQLVPNPRYLHFKPSQQHKYGKSKKRDKRSKHRKKVKAKKKVKDKKRKKKGHDYSTDPEYLAAVSAHANSGKVDFTFPDKGKMKVKRKRKRTSKTSADSKAIDPWKAIAPLAKWKVGGHGGGGSDPSDGDNSSESSESSSSSSDPSDSGSDDNQDDPPKDTSKQPSSDPPKQPSSNPPPGASSNDNQSSMYSTLQSFHHYKNANKWPSNLKITGEPTENLPRKIAEIEHWQRITGSDDKTVFTTLVTKGLDGKARERYLQKDMYDPKSVETLKKVFQLLYKSFDHRACMKRGYREFINQKQGVRPVGEYYDEYKLLVTRYRYTLNSIQQYVGADELRFADDLTDILVFRTFMNGLNERERELIMIEVEEKRLAASIDDLEGAVRRAHRLISPGHGIKGISAPRPRQSTRGQKRGDSKQHDDDQPKNGDQPRGRRRGRKGRGGRNGGGNNQNRGGTRGRGGGQDPSRSRSRGGGRGPKRFNGKCNYCGNEGHKEVDCRKKKRESGSNNGNGRGDSPRKDASHIECYQCGKKGHYKDKCPDNPKSPNFRGRAEGGTVPSESKKGKKKQSNLLNAQLRSQQQGQRNVYFVDTSGPTRNRNITQHRGQSRRHGTFNVANEEMDNVGTRWSA